MHTGPTHCQDPKPTALLTGLPQVSWEHHPLCIVLVVPTSNFKPPNHQALSFRRRAWAAAGLHVSRHPHAEIYNYSMVLLCSDVIFFS
jgi:hypothetical protein